MLDRLRLTPREDSSPCVGYPQPFVSNYWNTRSAESCEQVTEPLFPESAARAGTSSPLTVSTLQAKTSNLNIVNKTGGQIPLPWKSRLKLDPSLHLAEIQKTVLRKIYAIHAPKSTTPCLQLTNNRQVEIQCIL